MTDAPRPTGRPEPPDMIELRALGVSQPELADAVDLQLALTDIQRRVQLRIPVPSLDLSAARVARHAAEDRSLVAFADIPIEISQLRFVLRQTADVLQRFALVDDRDHARLQALARHGDAGRAAEAWFTRSNAHATTQSQDPDADLEQAVALALRPFLVRCADAVQQAPTLSAWTRCTCPVCGGEPDFGVIESADARRLICGQCGLRWAFEVGRCPYCPNHDPRLMTSFATEDRRYHVTACEVCRRYLKSYNEQQAPRAVIPTVDALRTLPLDAAAIQRGYEG